MISHKGMALIKFVAAAVFVLVCLFVSGDAEERCMEREREALLSFKSSLIDDYGILSSWRSGDCCEWYGVECSNTTGHVVTLLMDGGNYSDRGVLRGKVGSSLLQLHHLSYLDLSQNDFGGSKIPEFVGSMRQLQHLLLSESNFYGIVPPQIGNLTNLLSLDLSYNSLSTPNLDWLSTSFSSLSFLDLSQIDLRHTNWLHHIQSLPSLHELHLKNCNLSTTDVKPPPSKDLLTNSSSLSIINLSDNQLTRSSFDWLSNISTSLVKLDLSHNALRGPIPNEYFERSLPLIEHLDLSSNMLEGRIAISLGNLRRLRILVLYDNSFKGGFNELFGNLSISGKGGVSESLQILDLASNQLNGIVPDLSAFSAMTEVYLETNKFKGSMPLSLGQLSTLQVLDFSGNSLEGTVSESHFIKLGSLKVLDLSFNSGLKWNVSANWSPPFQLDVLLLGGCNVGPSFPKWIKTQKNVSAIDLSSGGIRDEAPDWFWTTFPLLEDLFLSDNQLRGTIPNLSSTEIIGLDLSYNRFSGPIPLLSAHADSILLNGNRLSGSISSLCEALHIELMMIDLSNNELGGEVPNCWNKSMPNLIVVNLNDNSFWGEIPPSLGTLQHLYTLQLRGNKFSGEFPSSLSRCQTLQMIDLEGNQFRGEIPAWIGGMFGLRNVNLRRNNLHGSIPPGLCNLTDVRILDLSVNHLSGEIPDCFTNFTHLAYRNTSMDIGFLGYRFRYYYNEDLPNINVRQLYTYSSFQWKGRESEYRKILKLLKLIDFSSNRLSGNIPQSFSSMKGLISLNLSRNNLTGNIIPDIGDMEMLECLDLSHNRFSGNIPASSGKLQLLAVLDLSNNSLSGKIPSSTQLQSFNASSYAGNDGLCGAPLPSCPPEDSNDAAPPGTVTEHDDDIFSFVQEVCISMTFGFIIGFWGFVASLVLKKSWRVAFFNSLDAAGDWFYVRTALFISKWSSA